MSGWDSTYTTGTISIAESATEVVGTGTFWIPLANQANLLLVGGQVALVTEVVDATHLTIPAWTGVEVVDADYVLVQFPLASLLATRQVRDLIASLRGVGVIYYVTDDEPDDEIGEDGQFALKVNDGPWTIWYKISGQWEVQAAPVGGLAYDVGGFSPDRPGSGENILSWLFNRTVTFPASLAGSRAKAGTAATADAVFSIKKNGSQIATVTIPAGQTTGTFAMASQTSFASGDVLDVVGPNPRDTTLADMHVTLLGTRN